MATTPMKQEVIYQTETNLSETRDYTKEEMVGILDKIEKQAKDLGYSNITFHFQSNMVPYEDNLDCPSIVAEGFIEKTMRDLAAEERVAYKAEMAKKLGCTLYDAGQYIMLQEKGLIQ
jgi:hypothetical protein